MTTQQLSSTQINRLFDFVRSKSVHFIDVQHELVDHLASAIEQEMEDSGVSFESALRMVYGRFPITGFAQFIEEKEIALRRYWRLRQFAYLKTYFTLPKVVMTIAICLLTWTILGFGVPWLNGLYFGLILSASLCASTSLLTRKPIESSVVASCVIVLGSMTAVLGVGGDSDRFGIGDDPALVVLGYLVIIFGYGFLHTINYGVKYVQNLKKYLVLSAFNGTVYILGTGLISWILYYPGNLAFFATTTFLPFKIFLSLMLSTSLLYSHASYTHFRFMLDIELKQKYPHLKFA